jgi:hypothetical protein
VLVGHHDRTLYHKAIGNRALEPSVEPMTLDTIFDARRSPSRSPPPPPS